MIDLLGSLICPIVMWAAVLIAVYGKPRQKPPGRSLVAINDAPEVYEEGIEDDGEWTTYEAVKSGPGSYTFY